MAVSIIGGARCGISTKIEGWVAMVVGFLPKALQDWRGFPPDIYHKYYGLRTPTHGKRFHRLFALTAWAPPSPMFQLVMI